MWPKILENFEILEKDHMMLEKQPSSQSSFQILNVDNSSQQIRKISYYIFEVLSTFTVVI